MHAVGQHTVRVNFKEPYAPAIFLFADETRGAIMPEHLLSRYADLNHIPFNRAPIGSGPYVLREWRHGDRLIFDANPLFFRGAPKIGRIELRIVPDTNTELTQLRTHEIDATTDLDPNQLAAVRGIPGIATRIVSTNGFRHVSFNTRRPPLNDPNVRRALCYAMDPDSIYQKTYFGVGLRAPADQNPGSGWADPTIHYYPHDPARAEAMLERAGWIRGADGIRTKNGRRLSIGLVSVTGAKANEAIEVALQDAWRAIGVEATIKNFPGTTLFAPAAGGGIILSGNFDAALYSLFRDPDPNDMGFMGPNGVPPNGFNTSFYADPLMGRLQVEAVRTFDLRRRHQLYDAIQRMIVRDVPIYTLLWVPLIEAYDARINNVKPSPTGIDFWNVTDWRMGG
ncbi:MAG: peptide ABC transporter substrate-binding protein [Candidatus Eremiobacteraeota bacterium]|nr:peptide ABC transporter substrate-binding protein [Candidatus Eremiobacteraeota bacterium]